MSEQEQLAAQVEPWLRQCGSCDAALPMACTCPDGDYRLILAKVWDAYLEAVQRAQEAERLLSRLIIPSEAFVVPTEDSAEPRYMETLDDSCGDLG